MRGCGGADKIICVACYGCNVCAGVDVVDSTCLVGGATVMFGRCGGEAVDPTCVACDGAMCACVLMLWTRISW